MQIVNYPSMGCQLSKRISVIKRRGLRKISPGQIISTQAVNGRTGLDEKGQSKPADGGHTEGTSISLVRTRDDEPNTDGTLSISAMNIANLSDMDLTDNRSIASDRASLGSWNSNIDRLVFPACTSKQELMAGATDNRNISADAIEAAIEGRLLRDFNDSEGSDDGSDKTFSLTGMNIFIHDKKPSESGMRKNMERSAIHKGMYRVNDGYAPYCMNDTPGEKQRRACRSTTPVHKHSMIRPSDTGITYDSDDDDVTDEELCMTQNIISLVGLPELPGSSGSIATGDKARKASDNLAMLRIQVWMDRCLATNDGPTHFRPNSENLPKNKGIG